jgi:hypothetical protein
LKENKLLAGLLQKGMKAAPKFQMPLSPPPRKASVPNSLTVLKPSAVQK